MREQKIKQYFTIIDYGIKVFNADKGFKVDATKYNDWLVFDQRSIRWTKGDLEYLLQVFPNFDKHEQIVSWTLYGAVSYDTESARYLTDYSEALEVPLEYIALNAATLLRNTYEYLRRVKKEDIPHAVDFNN